MLTRQRTGSKVFYFYSYEFLTGGCASEGDAEPLCHLVWHLAFAGVWRHVSYDLLPPHLYGTK